MSSGQPLQADGGTLSWAGALSQCWPSNGVTDIDATVSLSMQRALTLTPSGCDRGM